jgi:phosphoglycerate dehydrogenase-like enzyme
MVRTAVLDDWQGVARNSANWSLLQGRTEVVFFSEAFRDEDDAAGQLADFEILLSMRERTAMPASLIHRLPRARMIGVTGTMNASLDLAACTAQGILVCNTTLNSVRYSSTSELALGLLLAAARAIPAADANMRAGRFQQGLPIGITLDGKTMGIIGLGQLGSQFAKLCRALNMKIFAWSENLTTERAEAQGATLVEKDELLSRSDAISLHLKLSSRSRGIIGASEIARMKPGAILINTSRGGLIDEPALIAAVQQRRIVAALDVFDREPLPPSHPLCSAPNTILTPHLGYGVQEAWDEFYPQSIENALAFLDGKPIRVINPSVLQAK